MKLTTTKALLALFFILLLGGSLRLYKLGQQSFIGDEYYGLNASYGYAKSGEWKDWDFNKQELTDRVYKRSQVYYWQVAQVFKLHEPTEAISRLVSVAWGMIGIISIFVISFWVTGNYYIALISSFFMAVSVSSLMYDRNLRMYSMFVPVYLWFSFLLFRFIDSVPQKGFSFIKNISKKTGLNWNFFPLVIVIGLISFFTHLLTANIIPVFLVYLIILAGFTFIKEKNFFNKYFFLLLVGVLVVILGINSQRLQDALTFFSWNIHNWGYIKIATLDYGNILLAILFFIIGLYYLIKNNFKTGIWLLASHLTVFFLAVMVWRREPGDQYLLFTQSFKIIIISSGVFFVAKVISDKVFNKSSKWFLSLLLLFFVLLFNFNFFLSKDSFYASIKSWNYSNYREIFHYFINHRDYNSVLIIRDIPSKYYYLNGEYVDIINYNEKKGNQLTLEMVKDAQDKYKDVWIIFPRSFYIEGDALDYIEVNFKEIKNSLMNDQLEVWRWRNSDLINKK